METQIKSCIDSLLQIKATLTSLTNTNIEINQKTQSTKILNDYNINKESILQLRHAQNQLLHTLITLAKFQQEHRRNSNPGNIQLQLLIGSVVLAPRYFNGMICQDLAIVVDLQQVDDNDDIMSNQILAKSNLDICNDVETSIDYNNSNKNGNNVNWNIKVIWLRPISSYEMNSSGVTFPLTQLQSTGLEYYDQQSEFLSNIRLKDSIMIKSSDTHLWCEAIVQKIDDSSNQIVVEMKSQNILMLDFSAAHIAPLPRNYLQIQRQKAKALLLSSSSSSSSSSCHNNILSDNEEEDINQQKHYIDTSSLNTSSSSSSSTKSISFDQIIGLGGWEKHTKGIGGRILQKMGYTRGSGLGPRGQGIVVPVQGLLKALPAGLSLDYVSDHLNSNSNSNSNNIHGKSNSGVNNDGSSSSSTTTGARSIMDLNSILLKRDAFGFIDNTSQKSKKKSKQSQDSTSGTTAPSTSVFDFMNSMRSDNITAAGTLVSNKNNKGLNSSGKSHHSDDHNKIVNKSLNTISSYRKNTLNTKSLF